MTDAKLVSGRSTAARHPSELRWAPAAVAVLLILAYLVLIPVGVIHSANHSSPR